MESIIIAVLILMLVAGFGIITIAIGSIIYFLAWATIETFKENILIGIVTLLFSILIIGTILLIIISNIVKVWNIT